MDVASHLCGEPPNKVSVTFCLFTLHHIFIIEPTFFKGFLFMVLDTICKGKQWKIPQLY